MTQHGITLCIFSMNYPFLKISRKTLSGSIACFVTCCIIGLLFSFGLNTPTIMFGAFIATLTELSSVKINDNLSYDSTEITANEDFSSVVGENIVSSENEEFTVSAKTDQKQENNEEIIKKVSENSINHENLEEKKKTGFFSMLSNLMTSDKKINEVSDKISEKKKKPKKTKTDPNLFLFTDVVEEQSNSSNESVNDAENPEISNITEFEDEKETIEDIDTPSYLRKGSNQ